MIIDDAPPTIEQLQMEGPLLNLYCYQCADMKPHHHMHLVTRQNRSHVEGSEQFICSVCGSATFKVDDTKNEYPFKLDKAA